MGESKEFRLGNGGAPSGAVWRQTEAEHMDIAPPPCAWSKLWRQELHCSAIHEAGHLVVARQRGYWARARLYYPVNGGRHSLYWSGQTMLQPNVQPADAVAIGLAGFISEIIHIGGVTVADCPRVYADATYDDFTALSVSDRAYIASAGGIDPFDLQPRLIAEVAAEVAALRAEIRHEAAILIKAAQTLRLR
ncbi:MAG TPA: hypothetical protein VFL97_01515 [Nitrococcus sp.]|nr:hypothetical protein [Nitrococcus sp.]